MLGSAITASSATVYGWAVVIPPIAIFGGLTAAAAVGGIAGGYPAIRAAHLSPIEALRRA